MRIDLITKTRKYCKQRLSNISGNKIAQQIRMWEKPKKEKNYHRPLSESMIKKLKTCLEKQLRDNGEFSTIDDMNYAVAPLYKRGFIETRKRTVDNKLLHCIYVTDAGIKFLEKIESQ